MKRTLFAIAISAAMLIMPLAGTAQDKAADKGAMSYTGCFNKGTTADHYMLKDDKTGKMITVTGDSAMLSKHANNHKVTITGTMDKEGKVEVLKATDLKMVAMCQ